MCTDYVQLKCNCVCFWYKQCACSNCIVCDNLGEGLSVNKPRLHCYRIAYKLANIIAFIFQAGIKLIRCPFFLCQPSSCHRCSAHGQIYPFARRGFRMQSCESASYIFFFYHQCLWAYSSCFLCFFCTIYNFMLLCVERQRESHGNRHTRKKCVQLKKSKVNRIKSEVLWKKLSCNFEIRCSFFEVDFCVCVYYSFASRSFSFVGF